MNKIPQKDVARIADAASAYADLLAEIEVERELYDGQRQRRLEELAEKQEDLRGLLEDAALGAEDYFDNRSEAWQDSARGERYGEWRDSLRELADTIGDEIDVPELPEIEVPDWLPTLQAGEFSELPE